MPMTRRDAARNLLSFFAGSPLLCAQEAPRLADRLVSIDELYNVMEFENVARAHMVKSAYDYISGGADDEWTLRRNRDWFQKITFRPHFLVDVSKLDLSLELFGQKIEMPILVAPTAAHQQAHPEGELATIRAAGKVKTIMAVSSNSSYPIDKIGAAATGPFWFQLYTEPDQDAVRERVERALAAGAKAVVWTVDNQYLPHRERLLRDRLVDPGAPQIPGSATPPPRASRRGTGSAPNKYRVSPAFTGQLTWSFMSELRSYTPVPLLVKGILTGDDAKRAMENGAQGIVVSNHGGRYLDGAPSTIEVLPEIVDAVGGRIPVLIDGGFRRGTDVLKALAIGAKAVLVGRPPLWGLGAFGQAGVTRVLELLQTELALAMGLAGRPTLASIDRSLIRIDR
jgi:4-hydroxymandelate oxidase